MSADGFSRSNDSAAVDASRPIYPISSAPTVADERWPSTGYCLLWTGRWQLGCWTGLSWASEDGAVFMPQYWAPVPVDPLAEPL